MKYFSDNKSITIYFMISISFMTTERGLRRKRNLSYA